MLNSVQQNLHQIQNITICYGFEFTCVFKGHESQTRAIWGPEGSNICSLAPRIRGTPGRKEHSETSRNIYLIKELPAIENYSLTTETKKNKVSFIMKLLFTFVTDKKYKIWSY